MISTKIAHLLAILLFSLLLLHPSVLADNNVVINEFSSNTSHDDWVELYNTGTQSAQLSNLRMRDSASFIEDLQGELAAGAFLIVDFNNRLDKKGDIVRLMKLEGESEITIEEIAYGNSGGMCTPSDSGSIGRLPDGSSTIVRFNNSSKGVSNSSSEENPCPTPTSVPTDTPEPTKKPSVTERPIVIEKDNSTNKVPTVTKTYQEQREVSAKKDSQIPTNNKTSEGLVLGKDIFDSTDSAGTEASKSHRDRVVSNTLLFLLLGGGIVCLFSAAFLSYQEIKKRRVSRNYD